MIKSQITLKQLEAFAFVVDLGTFRAAATALGTTQPNISARIAALEAALGARLLIRDAGSVRLTDRGSVLLQRTREVIWAGEALLEEAGRRDLIEERLRLGVTELVACTWLQPFLRMFRDAYPGIQVELSVDLSTAIAAGLTEGQLDLAFQTGPFASDMSGDLALGTEPYGWFAVPDLADALGPRPTLDALFQHPVLTHSRQTQAGHALHAEAERLGQNPRRIVHSSALSACVPMVCEGLGVALLPRALVRQDVAAGTLRMLAADWHPDPLSFHARFDKDRAPRFVSQAAELAAQAMARDGT